MRAGEAAVFLPSPFSVLALSRFPSFSPFPPPRQRRRRRLLRLPPRESFSVGRSAVGFLPLSVPRRRRPLLQPLSSFHGSRLFRSTRLLSLYTRTLLSGKKHAGRGARGLREPTCIYTEREIGLARRKSRGSWYFIRCPISGPLEPPRDVDCAPPRAQSRGGLIFGRTFAEKQFNEFDKRGQRSFRGTETRTAVPISGSTMQPTRPSRPATPALPRR